MALRKMHAQHPTRALPLYKCGTEQCVLPPPPQQSPAARACIEGRSHHLCALRSFVCIIYHLCASFVRIIYHLCASFVRIICVTSICVHCVSGMGYKLDECACT